MTSCDMKLLRVFLVLGFLGLHPSEAEIPIPSESREDSELIVEVSKILCRARIKVLFVYFENQRTHDHSGEILREVTKCDISYISLRKRSKPLEAVKDDGVLMYMVMIIKDISQPLKLSLINKKSAAKHLSHVILLVRDSRRLSLGWMRASFRQFWNIWLLNIVIVFWRDNRLHVYRYNPFTKDFPLPLPLEVGELPTLGQLFPQSIPNMQRKPLRMCLYMDEVRAIYDQNGKILGTDGLLSEYIAERLNATRIITRPISFSLYNQSTDICSIEIANEYDDIAMNIRFLAPETFKKRAEPTIAHSRDDLCVIAPKAKWEPLFWNIFRSFGGLVWISILISVLLANVFCYFIAHEHDGWLALQLFSCILTQPIWHTPRHSSLRVFLLFWLYFGILICNAFKCNLTSMLVYRKPLPDINSLGALADSSYKILLRPRLVKHINQFMRTGHPNEGRIRESMLEIPDQVLISYFNSNTRSFAYLEKYHIAKFQVNARQHFRQGRPVYHLMNSCLVPYHAVYTVPYGSPYLGYFNRLIRSAYEFGFERYWDRIMNAAFIKSGTKVLHNHRGSSNSDDPVVLKLEHFHAVFFLWAIGTMLSLSVFLWELLLHNWAKAKLKH